MDTLVSHVLASFSTSTGFSDGLFVMTTAMDHKNNLNRSTIKKNFPKTLRVETIANSAGGTAAVAMVAQPSTGFLNGRFLPDGSPTDNTEDCLGRITVGLTRSKSLTIIVAQAMAVPEFVPITDPSLQNFKTRMQEHLRVPAVLNVTQCIACQAPRTVSHAGRFEHERSGICEACWDTLVGQDDASPHLT